MSDWAPPPHQACWQHRTFRRWWLGWECDRRVAWFINAALAEEVQRYGRLRPAGRAYLADRAARIVAWCVDPNNASEFLRDLHSNRPRRGERDTRDDLTLSLQRSVGRVTGVATAHGVVSRVDAAARRPDFWPAMRVLEGPVLERVAIFEQMPTWLPVVIDHVVETGTTRKVAEHVAVARRLAGVP